MSAIDTTLDEVKAAILADANFTGTGVHVVKDVQNVDGSLVEDDIGQSLEDDGRCVVIRIDAAGNPYPNAPGPQMDPVMLVEVMVEQGHESLSQSLRFYAEKAARVVHHFVPTNNRAIFASAGNFMTITEQEGIHIAQMQFTPPSGAS